MAVLLLRLSGPMQSWGTRSRFVDRDTELFPSKSGVIGLLCAALGRPREASLDDLTALRMAARADRPGRLETDYHVTRGILRASGSVSRDALPSWRHYLADACFLVGLEGERDLLTVCHAAFLRPRWFLALGRKSFVPAEPIYLPDGLRDETLETALRSYPWLGGDDRRRPNQLPVEWEVGPHEGQPRTDVPVSFAQPTRAFQVRWIARDDIATPSGSLRELSPCT